MFENVRLCHALVAPKQTPPKGGRPVTYRCDYHAEFAHYPTYKNSINISEHTEFLLEVDCTQIDWKH